MEAGWLKAAAVGPAAAEIQGILKLRSKWPLSPSELLVLLLAAVHLA